MIKQNKSKVVTGVARLSYANIWEPKSINGGPEKYSCSLLIPKTDTETVNAINAAIDCAIQEGAHKFGGKVPLKASLKLPLRDGDVEREDEAYKGCWFLNANSTTPPQVVDKRVRSILDHFIPKPSCRFFVADFSAIEARVIASILENAALLGLPIPEKLKSILAQLREGEEKS